MLPRATPEAGMAVAGARPARARPHRARSRPDAVVRRRRAPRGRRQRPRAAGGGRPRALRVEAPGQGPRLAGRRRPAPRPRSPSRCRVGEEAELVERARADARSAAAVLELAARLQDCVGIDELGDAVVTALLEHVSADRISFWVNSGDGLTRLVTACGPASDALLAQPPAPYRPDLAAADVAALLRGETWRTSGVQDAEWPDGLAPLPPASTLMQVPILEHGWLRASISVTRLDGGPFSARDVSTAQAFATQSALALRSWSARDEAERTIVATVEALLEALAAKDQYTSEHGLEVQHLTVETGVALGLGGEAAGTPGAGRGAARHRQDRRAARGAAQARAAGRDGARADPPAPHPRRAHPRARGAPPARDPAGALEPRALGRRRLPGRHGRRGHPARRPHHRGRRRLLRDDHGPPVPRLDAGRGRTPGAARARGHAVRRGRRARVPRRPRPRGRSAAPTRRPARRRRPAGGSPATGSPRGRRARARGRGRPRRCPRRRPPTPAPAPTGRRSASGRRSGCRPTGRAGSAPRRSTGSRSPAPAGAPPSGRGPSPW